MFTSPLSSLAGWTWDHSVATDLPDKLQLAFPPSAPGTPGPGARPSSDQLAVHGSGTTAAGLRFPASGRWHHAQQPGNVHWVWGQAADVLQHGSMRTRLTLGDPWLALRFLNPTDAPLDSGKSSGVHLRTPVELAATPVTTDDVTIVACAPGAPGLDTLAVLRYLADALNAEGLAEGTPTWQAFVTALAGLEQPLRVLEPGGSPATGRRVRVVGGAGPVTLTPAHHGDALAALGVTRAALASGPRLDVSDGADVVAVADATAFTDGRVPLTTTSSRVTVASLAHWLSAQQTTELTRYTRGNTVVPFADGDATLADLFKELNDAIDDGTPPAVGAEAAFYVTGYSLQHDVPLGPPDLPLRSVEEVAEAMGIQGGDPRFLALQMIQLEPDWVRDVETAVVIVALLIAIAGIVAAAAHESDAEGATFVLHAYGIAIAMLVGSSDLDSLLEGQELNRGSIEALDALTGVEAHLDPVDADVDDNPLAETQGDIVGLALDAQRRFNVFHQKIQVVRNGTGIHAYCGGIDLNANRTQGPAHASRGPFHDVHARIDGPAAGELATTFIERWRRAAPATTLRLDEPGALDDPPNTGPDVVQVARTYFRPAAGSGRGFTFAPLGESTILETLVQAIGQARRYIYIEDQYLTPPPRFTDALAEAAAAVSGPLVIVVPATPDQPFGLPRRLKFIDDMRAAWGDRVRVGILRKRFLHAATLKKSAAGRLWLAETLDEAADIVELAPPDRLPKTPFWLTVGEEAMRASRKVVGFSSPTSVQLQVERQSTSRLFGATSGTDRKTHRKGASALAGSFPSIYVHSKMMLIDDAFASIGSANANRRGFYSDGECNIFGLRDQVTEGDNWIRDLRLDLWAEHLGVPPEYARTALLDPAASLALIDRKFTIGNRFTTFDAQPTENGATMSLEFIESTSTLGGVVAVAKFIGGMAAVMAGADSDAVFNTIIDPSSELEQP